MGLGGGGAGFYASQPGISFREIPAFNSHPAGSFLNICRGFKEGWQQWEHIISPARCTHSNGCRNRSWTGSKANSPPSPASLGL